MQKFKQTALFLLCCLPLTAFHFTTDKPAAHEFHISKCQIEYNEKESALQMTLHLFIDDLEEALAMQGAVNLFICTEKEAEKAEIYMYKYLQRQLKIQLDDSTVDYTFIGKEVSEDLIGVWCYLEVENIPTFEKLSVRNGILTETFEDQKNIVSVVGPQKKKGYFLLDATQKEASLNF
ncbi:MAG: DUF6702 family protein [Bacteroidota bacterium]